MKSTGIVRRLDDLGRITLPIELRRTLDVKERDPLEIYVEEDSIVLKKYNSIKTCRFCNSRINVVTSHDNEISVCKECAAKIINMFGE